MPEKNPYAPIGWKDKTKDPKLVVDNTVQATPRAPDPPPAKQISPYMNPRDERSGQDTIPANYRPRKQISKWMVAND